MDITRLDKILNQTTLLFRKERPPRRERRATPLHPGVGAVTTIDVEALSHEREIPREFAKIDFEILIVAVDGNVAERYRAELLRLLTAYPRPSRLRAGISYVEVTGDVGDRVRALKLLALGKALSLWDLITPATLRLKGEAALRLAELGIIMTSGFAGEWLGPPQAAADQASAPARVALGTRR